MTARVAIWIILASALSAPLVAQSASSFYKDGTRAERKKDVDAAYQAFRAAHDLKPSEPAYMLAYLRLRTQAAAAHIDSGQRLYTEGNLQAAMIQFQIATQIDPSNFQASGWAKRVSNEIEKQKRDHVPPGREEAKLKQSANSAAGPVELIYKADLPVSIQMTTTADVLYKTIGKLGGLNVLIDPDYKPQKLTFELKDVTLHQALDMLAIQSKTFWRPLAANTILVSSDTTAKHKDFDQSVMKTFYLRNASSPEQLQAAAGTLKGILDITHVQVTPEMRSLTLRGTPDQMIFAQKLLTDIDKPGAEVIIDILVMEVNRNRLRTFGTTLPTSVSASITPPGGTSGSGAAAGLSLASFASLGASDISVSVSGATFTALASDASTKVIQRPQIRVMDDQKASLKIGDRIPIATGSFQSGLTQGVNTQFQYIDVGVNIDITPHVHGDNEVTLKMSLEISSVTGEQTISGVTEPTIGQRRIDHEARLADGEVNLIGGILEDSESTSLSGYPWLTKIPILKYLFGQEAKQRQQNEIVFAIVPHIIRSSPITDDDLRMVDLGFPSSVKYRTQEVHPDVVAATTQPAADDRKTPIQPTPPAAAPRAR